MSKPEIVLIDDEKFIHLAWQLVCKKAGIPFKSFNSVDEFLVEANNFSNDICIYVDSCLGNGVLGEIESEKIYNYGFKNIYLSTSYDKDYIKKPRWIKEVFSKRIDEILALGYA
jgi:hypothetical protein